MMRPDLISTVRSGSAVELDCDFRRHLVESSPNFVGGLGQPIRIYVYSDPAP